MTELEKIHNLKPGTVEAINGFLAFHEAINRSQLSIQDLIDGLSLAIEPPQDGEDGDGTLISLEMMRIALETDRKLF